MNADDVDDVWDNAEPDPEASQTYAGTRFGEGQSRQGGGRPKGSSNRHTIIKRVARKRHKVKIDGRMQTKTTLELVLMTIRTQAASGNIAAFDLQETLKRRFAARPSRSAATFIKPEKLTAEEWDAQYGWPETDEEAHQRNIMERFPYMLPHRLEWLRYQREIDQATGNSRPADQP